MSGPYELSGPFYVELAYEAEEGTCGDQIRTAYIDGIATEADAWRTCGSLRADSISAVSDEGETISIAPEQILQLLIGRTMQTPFPALAI